MLALPSFPVCSQCGFGLVFATLLSVGLTGCGASAGGVNIWDAVRADDPDQVAKYAQAGGDLNIQKRDGTTPLLLALDEEKRRSYEKLLELGADPNFVTTKWRAAGTAAAAKKDPFWLRLALENGGDPNLQNVGAPRLRQGTPMFWAIYGGSFENIKLLVENGADLDATDDLGRTPLVHATMTNRFDVILYLLEQGADYTITVPGDKYRSFLSVLKTRQSEWFKPEQRKQLEAVRQWLAERGVDVSEEP